MNAQKIAEIKAEHVESLWQFLSAVPGSFEAQVFYGFIIAGTVGVSASFIYKWLTRQIAGSLFRYLFVDDVRRTLLSFAVLIGQAITAITMGLFAIDDGTFVGWWNVLYIGALAGFTGDVIANKGKTPA